MSEKMRLVEELKEAKQQRESLKDEFMWSEVHKNREELTRLENITEEHEMKKTEFEDEVIKIMQENAKKEEKVR